MADSLAQDAGHAGQERLDGGDAEVLHEGWQREHVGRCERCPLLGAFNVTQPECVL